MNEKYMREAIVEAKNALAIDEVPVGAVIVKNDEIIARAYNQREKKQNAIAHAEILAIEEACKKVGFWRLENCDIYITMEPCLMCSGAIINARIDNVYFGARDKRIGCVEGVLNVFDIKEFNHNPKYQGGILEKDCSLILSNYFQQKRKRK